MKKKESMEEKITVVFHGFLNLSAKEKLKLVGEINKYFDSNNREPIREENESNFQKIDLVKQACVCCGKQAE